MANSFCEDSFRTWLESLAYLAKGERGKGQKSMAKAAEIRASLEAAFQVQEIEVINESSQHAGHTGDDGTGESHFRVRLKAEGFSQMSRVARHRAVHAALGSLTEEIHALALELS